MVKQRWFSFCTSASSYSPSLYRRRLLLVVTALLLVLTPPLPVVATTITSRSGGPALRRRTEQNQLARHIPEETQQQRWRWFSISGFHTTTSSDKEGRRSRRRLIGSLPLSCHFRCGGCMPCRAVAIPIQPWRIRPLEYYPEAWRCQCGNKLFIP